MLDFVLWALVWLGSLLGLLLVIALWLVLIAFTIFVIVDIVQDFRNPDIEED